MKLKQLEVEVTFLTTMDEMKEEQDHVVSNNRYVLRGDFHFKKEARVRKGPEEGRNGQCKWSEGMKYSCSWFLNIISLYPFVLLFPASNMSYIFIPYLLCSHTQKSAGETPSKNLSVKGGNYTNTTITCE